VRIGLWLVRIINFVGFFGDLSWISSLRKFGHKPFSI
jgi:hypothetical protein